MQIILPLNISLFFSITDLASSLQLFLLALFFRLIVRYVNRHLFFSS